VVVRATKGAALPAGDAGVWAQREAWSLGDLDVLDPVERSSWRDLQAVVRLRTARELNGSVRVQDRYFLTSHVKVGKVTYAVRAHWVLALGACIGCSMSSSLSTRAGLVLGMSRRIW
jgi:hypothetical protein